MNDLSPGLREYYRAVERTIPGSGKDKKRYLNDIWDSLLNLQTECPNAGYDMAVDRIGELDELNDIWTQTMRNGRRPFSRHLKILLGAITAVVIGVVLFLGYQAGHQTQVTLVGTRTIYEDSSLTLEEYEKMEEHDQKMEEIKYNEEN